MEYPLESRTFEFSKNVIFLCKRLPQNQYNKPLISQVLRSSTSVGANYCEANGASSKSDFRNKIHICKKEAQETRYWLKLLEASNNTIDGLDGLIQEAHEFTLIFVKIAK